MSKSKKPEKKIRPLNAADFAGDGEPFSEVTVTISIRILGKGITRSRLAVNVVPDPALEPLALKSLHDLGIESFGLDEHGNFGACLSANFSGWRDLNKDYPKLDESAKKPYDQQCLAAMNAYIKQSVDWALMLNKQGMGEVDRNDPPPRARGLVM